MRSFTSEIKDDRKWKVKIDYSPEIINRNLNMIQRRNIYMIFKEALNNAQKYSNGKEIRIEININKDLMKLEIEDNGKGFDLNKIKR